jgi:hypothetical protein
MRIRVFTGLCVALLCGISVGQRPGNALRADRVVVLKKERTLQLLNNGKVIKSYKIALGGNPVGPKEKQGDHKTPEGTYLLDSRNAHSQFYKAIHISYPNERDRAAAQAHHRRIMCLRVGTYLFTACQTAMSGLDHGIDSRIGRMAVLP